MDHHDDCGSYQNKDMPQHGSRFFQEAALRKKLDDAKATSYRWAFGHEEGGGVGL